jgi:hypothetical protein
MKIFKAMVSITVLSLLLSNCNLPANTSTLEINEASKKENSQSSSDGKSKQEQNEDAQRMSSYKSVKNLPNGSYRLCSESGLLNVPEHEQVWGWCFGFRKNGNNVVGIYTLWEPTENAQICISGIVKNTKVMGSGYEAIENRSKPITYSQEEILRLYGNDIWNTRSKRLKVSMPRLHSTGRYAANSDSYYAWVRYDNITLDLDNFFQRDLEDYVPPKKCPRN